MGKKMTEIKPRTSKKKSKKKNANKKSKSKTKKKKELKVKPKMGRPALLPASAINDAFIHEVFTMAKYHMTISGIADALGLSRQTFNDYQLRYPEIRDALRIGRAGGDFEIDQTLYNRCLSGEMAAIRWFDITRRGITPETPNIDVHDKDRIDLSLLSEQELIQFENLARKATASNNEIEGVYSKVD